MNSIESTVSRARIRMILGRFGRLCCWTIAVGLAIAALAIVSVVWWDVPVDLTNWAIGCVATGLGGGMAVAACIAGWSAPSRQAAAEEVDRRFGLRERVGSAMGMSHSQRETEFGKALVSDADVRAGQLAVADRFALRPSRLGWLPLSMVPVCIAAFLLVKQYGDAPSAVIEATEVSAETKQVQTVARQLRKTLKEQKERAEAEGLEEARELFEKMEADLEKVAQQKQMSRKEALIALNELKDQLDQRRENLGSPEQMRRAMSQMKGLDSGPAKKVADAIKDGQFGDAQKMIKDLAKKVREGNLSKADQKKLAEQVKQMQQQMKQAVENHEKKKQDLQRQIDQARREGRTSDAEQMQQKLDQLRQQDGQMQKMQQMAEAMSNAAQAMEQGDASSAADAMQQMADQLGDMADEMSELEDLQSAMDDLLQSKQQMGCQQCQGMGCQGCQGGMQGDKPGNGLGRGAGQGDRPESETDTNFYDSQVRGDVRRGRAIIAGFADGPNRKGVTREDLKSVIESELDEAANPLENQNLPRAEQEHTQQYFDRLRSGR
ncbi:hypothetical protein [Crateriforma conspicua]|uniref:Chromosome partition protein Smc n=2 Tax=Crateriforma conspicua TaxID=2527996 RepID=A0A5C5Y856_9PLAN|nr:hypothetical protein [Crateriforma conspicua]QDV65594.1 hypothetical protein Mal65_47670 [Crateriforma conspicua]TWT70993.1 hypothetical protein Pan14r_33030 [Crateriforma conspicua]